MARAAPRNAARNWIRFAKQGVLVQGVQEALAFAERNARPFECRADFLGSKTGRAGFQQIQLLQHAHHGVAVEIFGNAYRRAHVLAHPKNNLGRRSRALAVTSAPAAALQTSSWPPGG